MADPHIPSKNIHINFGLAGNSEEFATEGWSNSETGYRWAVGKTSVIEIPKVDFPSEVLVTLKVSPFLQPEGVPIQNLSVFVNEFKVDEFALAEGWRRYSIVVPWGRFSIFKTNTIEFRHPNANSPADFGGSDSRQLAVSFQSMSIECDDWRLFFAAPMLLRDTTKLEAVAQLRALANRFQSLGENSEFSVFQRACGVDISGFSQFSSIFLPPFLEGLDAGFAEIGDVAELDLTCETQSENYLIVHRRYGFQYRSTKPTNVSIEAFAGSEANRLSRTFRDLLEQTANADKIFVFRQGTPALKLREVIPLLRVLRKHNQKNALLWITEASPGQEELLGRVEWLAPFFYHGYIDQSRSIDVEAMMTSDSLVQVCRTVVAAVDVARSLDPHAK